MLGRETWTRACFSKERTPERCACCLALDKMAHDAPFAGCSGDFFLVLLCFPLSVCQEARELEIRSFWTVPFR